MARGWESKSVEQQQADMANDAKSAGPRLSPTQQRLARQRDGLLLSRKRLLQQLQTAVHPRHRRMLEQALGEIDRQLSSLDQVI